MPLHTVGVSQKESRPRVFNSMKTRPSFACIELDSTCPEARLPHDKLKKCISLITDFSRRKKVTLRELHSLLGLLNFACSVVVPGRAFHHNRLLYYMAGSANGQDKANPMF